MPEQLAAATVRRQVSVPLRFADGYAAPARLFTFAGLVDGREHLAIGLGDRSQPWPGAGGSDGSDGSDGSERPPLVRPHSECLTGDVLGSQRCDCGAQLREAVERISEWGGYLLYLRQEGRGIGLYAKLDAYALQDAGLDTYEANVALGYPADQRSYAVAAQMLHALGETQVLLLTNNPMKEVELVRWGVSISERVPTGVHLSPANARYLSAKVRRGAHALDLPSTEPS